MPAGQVHDIKAAPSRLWPSFVLGGGGFALLGLFILSAIFPFTIGGVKIDGASATGLILPLVAIPLIVAFIDIRLRGTFETLYGPAYGGANRASISPGRPELVEPSEFAGPSGAKSEQANEATAATNGLFKAISALAVDGILLVNAKGVIVHWNDAAKEIFGYREQEIIGKPLTTIISKQFHEAHRRGMDCAATIGECKKTPQMLELTALRNDGREFPIELRFDVIPGDDSPLYLGIIRDISSKKNFEMLLHRQANFDHVTDLPSRYLIIDRLDGAIASGRRGGKAVAALFIDLDNFKTINDVFGHVVGDRVLRFVGERLRKCVRGEDTVGRLGGDEFIVIIPVLAASIYAELVAKKIQTILEAPYQIDENEFRLTASIGIAIHPADGDGAAALLKNAEMAMYRAKEFGKGNYRFFTADIDARTRERAVLERELRTAQEKNELWIAYQPIIASENILPVGAEALLRWSSAHLGQVPPDKFIPIAEELGLLTKIGAWVLEQACLQAAKFSRSAGRPLRMAVNISSRQLRGTGFIDVVARSIAAAGIDPKQLELEITERVAVDCAGDSAIILNELREMGVSLSIDDFGTGFSSLSYLRDFPFDAVKIDRSFVRGLPGNRKNRALVSAVIAMAKALGVRVVAEGVEESAQADFLGASECDLLQGYRFGRPMNAGNFDGYLKNSMRAPVGADLIEA